MRSLAILLALTLIPPPSHAQTATDATGHTVPLLPANTTRAAVLFFIASDCPISNRTLPEMQRLARLFQPRGVAFWFVYPNLTETPATLAAHRKDFFGGTSVQTVTDPHQRLARLTGAKLTPEAAVLLPGGKTAYIGRIDDRYLAIGTEQPTAHHHDLEDALTAALAGRPIPAPGGPPVGCGIVSTR